MADPPIDLHCRHFENSLRRGWDIGVSAFQPRALQGCSWATLGSYILQPHVSVKRLKRVRSHLARDAKPIQWRISSSWVRGGARSIVFWCGFCDDGPRDLPARSVSFGFRMCDAAHAVKNASGLITVLGRIRADRAIGGCTILETFAVEGNWTEFNANESMKSAEKPGKLDTISSKWLGCIPTRLHRTGFSRSITARRPY
ncbi:hypothetical protein ASPSYDRAFT_731445 [Aspergillus sydowii CBS 593.65]|uniref:Uncharacterized protein n=1 Tax=Aspergillus sydowii CBS 593.65 TaxID=1036612 RepID=A0A1L9TLV6_9EURO|nr:uncharacterized protein ASPSYDRAFT_731445 [Aspergillus sydowii CBS 593.65]OJJ60414.1 hypothetical protein ASPSYDRAFT_731445 [Aspergillus sydowii CBS 593.65]